LQRVSLRVVPVNNARSGIDVRAICHAKLMSPAKQGKDRLTDSRSQQQDSENQD
jgi:hypothetical protein